MPASSPAASPPAQGCGAAHICSGACARPLSPQPAPTHSPSPTSTSPPRCQTLLDLFRSGGERPRQQRVSGESACATAGTSFANPGSSSGRFQPFGSIDSSSGAAAAAARPVLPETPTAAGASLTAAGGASDVTAFQQQLTVLKEQLLITISALARRVGSAGELADAVAVGLRSAATASSGSQGDGAAAADAPSLVGAMALECCATAADAVLGGGCFAGDAAAAQLPSGVLPQELVALLLPVLRSWPPGLTRDAYQLLASLAAAAPQVRMVGADRWCGQAGMPFSLLAQRVAFGVHMAVQVGAGLVYSQGSCATTLPQRLSLNTICHPLLLSLAPIPTGLQPAVAGSGCGAGCLGRPGAHRQQQQQQRRPHRPKPCQLCLRRRSGARGAARPRPAAGRCAGGSAAAAAAAARMGGRRLCAQQRQQRRACGTRGAAASQQPAQCAGRRGRGAGACAAGAAATRQLRCAAGGGAHRWAACSAGRRLGDRVRVHCRCGAGGAGRAGAQWVTA